MAEELWKVIPEYNLYEVSSLGRVRCKERVKKCGHGHHMQKEHLLKLMNNKYGYYYVQFKQDGKCHKYYVHRLVAMAFIPNPENKPYINHKDNNPHNNCVDNLEWCTPKENYDWMAIQGRNKRTKQWLERLHSSQSKFYTPVIATNIKTGETLSFPKLNDVSKKGFQPSCVSNCCKGKRMTHKGYYWKYANIKEGE